MVMAGLSPTASGAAHDELRSCEAVQFGVIPWRIGRRGGMEILLITSRRRQRWIVPKGWLVKGRTPVQSASQEAFEEAGVVGQAKPHAVGSYSYMKMRNDGSEERCHVTLFGLHVRGTLINWPERKQRRRQWFGFDEAAEIIDEPELARLVNALQFNPGIF